jgi:hypothetical protein
MTPNPQDPTEKVLVNAVTENTTSDAFEHPHASLITYQIEVSGGSPGADIAIQHLAVSGNWKDVHTTTAAASDVEEPIDVIGRFDATRAVISNYTGGTITITASAL